MLKNKKIAVIIPAFNEEELIAKTITTIPDFVDCIIVIDDKSTDKTVDIVTEYAKTNDRTVLIKHEINQGVGGAMATGYKAALKENIDVVACMNGDAQMNPAELEKICMPVIDEEYDYVKGNRLIYGQSWGKIPKIRYLGNCGLSLLTKIASGYWHVADSQTGYTAISLKAMQHIDWDKVYKKYGVPNDILVRLNIINARVKEIPVEPIYNIGEKSGIKYHKVIFTIPWILLKLFLKRLVNKYIIRDFHPLIFFYLLSVILWFMSFILTVRLLAIWFTIHELAKMSAMALIFCVVSAMQAMFFAMWFDIEDNRKLSDRNFKS